MIETCEGASSSSGSMPPLVNLREVPRDEVPGDAWDDQMISAGVSSPSNGASDDDAIGAQGISAQQPVDSEAEQEEEVDLSDEQILAQLERDWNSLLARRAATM